MDKPCATCQKAPRHNQRSYCRACASSHALRRRTENAEREKVRAREYYLKNKAEYQRRQIEYRERNKEKLQAENSERYQANKAAYNTRGAKWKAENPDKWALIIRRAQVRRYGISLEDYEEMLRAQDSKCKICNRESEQTLCVDHCHGSNKVRGLLCRNCNTGIGLLGHDLDRFRAAINYLA